MSGRGIVPLPCIVLIANRQALRELSHYFARLASLPDPSTREYGDPYDHDHTGTGERGYDPFNFELSDRVEIRIERLSDENRKFVFKRFGVSKSRRKHGSLVGRYRTLIDNVEKWCAPRPKQERLRKKRLQA